MGSSSVVQNKHKGVCVCMWVGGWGLLIMVIMMISSAVQMLNQQFNNTTYTYKVRLG